MIVSDVNELTIASVLERGNPNKECIAIQAQQSLNLGQYGIMIGRFSGSNSAAPFRDNLFWFGDAIVQQGDWIFIYTGAGVATQVKASNNINNIYTTFWGRPNTLFADSSTVPMLIRVDAVSVPSPPINTPQIGA